MGTSPLEAEKRPRWVRAGRSVGHGLTVMVGAVAFTALLFFVLPLIQAITEHAEPDLIVRSADTGALPPPPPPPDDPEPEPEPEPEPPPQLEEAPPLDLSQLELAMNPGGMGTGWGGAGGLGDKLDAMNSASQGMGSAIVSMADLDQKPRATNQVMPEVSDAMRRKGPVTVYVLFVVDERGRVQTPRVQGTADPLFERPALNAVKKWRFEPGKRNGEPVSFRMRAPISFNKNS